MRLPNVFIGYHGCDRAIAERIFSGQAMRQSTNDHDWLGHGIYFWENDLKRAKQWAAPKSNPAVVGAYIMPGLCLDLGEQESLDVIRLGYEFLAEQKKSAKETMPINAGSTPDRLRRNLDCAVINTVHRMIHDAGMAPYDMVRGAFWEGGELYPGAEIQKKSHIQICVRNPACILGFFKPQGETY